MAETSGNRQVSRAVLINRIFWLTLSVLGVVIGIVVFALAIKDGEGFTAIGIGIMLFLFSLPTFFANIWAMRKIRAYQRGQA